MRYLEVKWLMVGVCMVPRMPAVIMKGGGHAILIV